LILRNIPCIDSRIEVEDGGVPQVLLEGDSETVGHIYAATTTDRAEEYANGSLTGAAGDAVVMVDYGQKN